MINRVAKAQNKEIHSLKMVYKKNIRVKISVLLEVMCIDF